jgi:hypothetical protein
MPMTEDALLRQRHPRGARPPQLGLRANLGQFSLLVLINAFVGAMVGLERTVVPLIGEREFGLASKTAIVSFIVSFGVTKAVLNLVGARLSERVGRKQFSGGRESGSIAADQDQLGAMRPDLARDLESDAGAAADDDHNVVVHGRHQGFPASTVVSVALAIPGIHREPRPRGRW